ncbi:facilitated trehalose transporter Tret1-2 homolog [Periplaneta americana]|uniref:facilitated trehalose transporter Tret1-2 homolog n=1 Tax=Periplaneta americana TaxID=6978 RepID=UPI0037E79099
MTTFYGSNLCLQTGEIANITGALSARDSKDANIPTWIPESRSSTDILIKPSKPRLFPQLLAALLSCWVNLASGASLGYATPALPSLQNPDSRLQITENEGSWVASLMMLGALVGGVLAGPCISLGRRRALWLVAIPLIFAWILIALAPNVLSLYVAHFVLGTCLGIIADASQLYVSETASAQWRGALGCVPVLMFNVGILVCYTAGAWLDWEELALFGGALTLPALLLPFVLPESPSYLVARGRIEQAIAALRWLRGPVYDITAEFQELMHCEKGPGLLERLRGLCDREILRPLLLTGSIRALSRFCGLRAILCYTQTILLSSRSSLDVEVATIVIGAVQLVATLVACGLLDRLGRRKLLIASQAIMGLSLVGLACYHYYHNDLDGMGGTLLGWLPMVAIMIYIIANSIGLGPVSGIIIGELVPQRHRSIASSITGAISWLSAFIVTKTFLDLSSTLKLHGALWLYGSVCLLGVPFVFFCVPETRGISQYGIEVLFRPKSDQNNGAIVTKMGHRKSLVVAQVKGKKSNICDDCSTQSSDISNSETISV